MAIYKVGPLHEWPQRHSYLYFRNDCRGSTVLAVASTGHTFLSTPH